MFGDVTGLEVEQCRQFAQQATGQFAHMGVPALACDGGHLDQGSVRPHFEGDGIGAAGEVAHDDPDVAEGVVDGLERPDTRCEDRAVADPEQLLADVEGDGVVAGDGASRVEEGDRLVERSPLVGLAGCSQRQVLRGQVEGPGQASVAGFGSNKGDQRLDDGP